MDHVLPAGKVFQAGTLSGNPLAAAAGIATLKILRDTNPYPQLQRLSERLAKGLAEAAASAGIPASVGMCGAMMTLFFSPDPVVDWPTASKCDTKRYARYFWGLIERGIYMPPVNSGPFSCPPPTPTPTLTPPSPPPRKRLPKHKATTVFRAIHKAATVSRANCPIANEKHKLQIERRNHSRPFSV